MNMGVNIIKGHSNSRNIMRSSINEGSRGALFSSEIEAFFEQFDKSIQEIIRPLFEKEDPRKATFVCMSCGESFPGAKIKKGLCPECSGDEVFPKDFTV